MISVHSKDYIEYYDELFDSNTFNLYTDMEIDDDGSLDEIVDKNIINRHIIHEYWNDSDNYSYLYLNAYNCDFDHMRCDFSATWSKSEDGDWSNETIKEYEDVSIIINSDIGQYFEMVDSDGNVTINYDESMFNSDPDARDSYIQQYIYGFNSHMNNNSVSYEYLKNLDAIMRIEQNNSITSRVMMKKVNNVIFDYTEEPFSDDFKTLTSGTLTIKSDTAITREILDDYLGHKGLTAKNISFSIDGDISDNKVYIKMTQYDNGANTLLEKHLVTLVQDPDIDTSLFEKVGYETDVNIAAEEPSKEVYDYISRYFNAYNFSYQDDDSYENYNRIYEHNNIDDAVIVYKKTDNSNGNIIDIEYHRIPINFIGYSDVISDSYQKKVGDEIVINADTLSLDTINSNTNSNLTALGCNDDYSYCDIALEDYDNKTVEIHKVRIVLNDTISDEFIKGFNIKNDKTIDIIIDDEDFFESNYLYYYYYDEDNNNSFDYSCDNNKCTLYMRNYYTNNFESHTINYNKIISDATKSYKSIVNSSIEVYPGETDDIYDRVRWSNELFKKDKKASVYILGCDAESSKCTVATRNSDKKIEIHDTNIITKEGRSPRYNSLFPGNTLKINSIYRDDSEYIYYVSMGYLLSKTKTWSYLEDFDKNKAKVVFESLESHTMDIEFAKGNDEHKKIVEETIDKIGSKEIKLTLDDLDYVNNFYYSDNSTGVATNYNSKKLFDTLSGIIDNKHINYFFVPGAGAGAQFISISGGKLVLFYDGIAYGITKSNITMNMQHIIYIPDNTKDTKEAYVKAAQKRIDKYFGKNSGVVISFDHVVEDQSEVDYLGIDEYDGNAYKISYKDNENWILIIKDSSKMQTGTFNAIDVNNNIIVSSDNANYPSNTVVSGEKIDKSNKEYKEILKKLGIDNAMIVDIDLYSPTLGDIEEFDNVNFVVNLPIDLDKFKGKKLYAYYINGDKIEEHPIELDDFVGSFETDHFSTYIISEKVDDEKILKGLNPNTGDMIVRHILIAIFSLLGLVGIFRYTKKLSNK